MYSEILFCELRISFTELGFWVAYCDFVFCTGIFLGGKSGVRVVYWDLVLSSGSLCCVMVFSFVNWDFVLYTGIYLSSGILFNVLGFYLVFCLYEPCKDPIHNG